MRRNVIIERRSGSVVFGTVVDDEWQVSPGVINSPVDAIDFPEDAVNEAADLGAKWVKVLPEPAGWVPMKTLKGDGVRYFDADGEDAIYYPIKQLWFRRPLEGEWVQLEFPL